MKKDRLPLFLSFDYLHRHMFLTCSCLHLSPLHRLPGCLHPHTLARYLKPTAQREHARKCTYTASNYVTWCPLRSSTSSSTMPFWRPVCAERRPSWWTSLRSLTKTCCGWTLRAIPPSSGKSFRSVSAAGRQQQHRRHDLGGSLSAD